MAGDHETGDHNATAGAYGYEEHGEDDHGESHIHEVYAVLLPWFVQGLGICVFYILTRKLHALPYTAVLFVLGVLMGAGAQLTGYDDILSQSIALWMGIDWEVLFNVFLPGLLFKDALETDVHLFQASIWQLLGLAFPLVLLGTYLTALVAYYIFPYGWSFMQSMTLGAILAATDPVAVAALLNEVGAPPRMKVHISGESLLNDGSAVVFFFVFGGQFLSELGIEAEGFSAVSAGEGVLRFFRMSLGGACIGFCFAMGLVFILYKLNRRMEKEEIVLQVTATATTAYLCFFTSEIVCGCSGVIAVVICGLFTKGFGFGMISDWQVMNSFWSLVEHLLNTLIFALGGIVFGEILARREFWSGQDWGYLFLLYVMVNLIRFFLIFLYFPINVRIGLSTNWREAVFASWGGLRGAVGITLALALDNFVYSDTQDMAEEDRNELLVLTTKLFGMVGGISLLTLIINGTSCGPVLKALGLADSSEARKRIVACANEAARYRVLDDFLFLMTDERFHFVDFALVMHHCPLLKNLTADELVAALEGNKQSVHPNFYRAPFLDHVLPYIEEATVVKAALMKNSEESALSRSFLPEPMDTLQEEEVGEQNGEKESFLENEQSVHVPTPDLMKDTRIMFIELLRAAYSAQIRDGELDPREYDGFLVHTFFQSLDFAQDAVSNGDPLCDWESCQVKSPKLVLKVDYLARSALKRISSCTEKRVDDLGSTERRGISIWDGDSYEYEQLRLAVLLALSFVDAHSDAQDRLRDEFGNSTGETAAAFQAVMAESEAEVNRAREVLSSSNKKKLKRVISHYLCIMLQNKAARYVDVLFESGVLLQKEARHMLEEIEHSIEHIRMCHLDKHPGSLDFTDDDWDVVHDPKRNRIRPTHGHASVLARPSTRNLGSVHDERQSRALSIHRSMMISL